MAKLLMNIGYGHMMTDIAVIAPDYALIKEHNGLDRSKKLPVMWLFHDFGGNCNDWSRYGNLELLAKDKNMFIICPSANNSYYINGGPFMTYYSIVATDLWDFAMRSFPVSDKPEDNYVVGNGMGGYGAVLYALKNPAKYGHAFSFNGSLNAAASYGKDGKVTNPHIFERADSEYDVFKLLGETGSAEYKLVVTADCEYLEDNKSFADKAKAAGLNVTLDVCTESADWYWLSRQLGNVMNCI